MFTLVETCVSLNHSHRQRHSPAALVVEEEHEVEFLFGLVLHLFSDAEHVGGWHGDGHPIVLAAHSRHVGVEDLCTAGDERGQLHTNMHIKSNAHITACTIKCSI